MKFLVSWVRRSSGALHSVQRAFLTDLSVQPIGSIFKGWEIQEDSWPLKMGPIGFPERRYGITILGCVISQKSIYTVAGPWNRLKSVYSSK
jgi:hypothetical protein